MKTTLLFGHTVLLLFSCAESTNQDALSDEEMKNRVEMEEIEFDEKLQDFQLKDSMKVEESRSDESTINSSLGKMENEVPRTFPLPQVHKEQKWKEIPEPPPILCCLGCPTESEENHIHNFPDTEAQYPGGIHELKVFIAQNLKYPDPIGCYEGRVYVTFIVEKDGSVTHAEVMREVTKELDEEALRVVRAMPKWIPAKQNGELVASRVRIPVSFTLH